MKQQNVHYFPGHMQKALRILSGYVKSVDLIVELVDSRAPLASRNPLLNELAGQKARLLLLTKSDSSDPDVTKAWLRYFSKTGVPAIAGNLKKDRFVSLLAEASTPLVASKREKEKRYGMKKQPIRVMVIGIPNVGKSTLINNIRGRKVAVVGNKAGVTRAEQWIKINDDFTLLDTPGILPMNYPTSEQAVKLALLGSMREDVLPTEDIAESLFIYIKEEYPLFLRDRFGIEDASKMTSEEAFAAIASRRGLLEGGDLSLNKAAYLLIKEFKDGLLGNISLEKPEC